MTSLPGLVPRTRWSGLTSYTTAVRSMAFKDRREVMYPTDDRIVGRIKRWHLISIRLRLNNSHFRSFDEVRIILIVKGIYATLDGFFLDDTLKTVSAYMSKAGVRDVAHSPPSTLQISVSMP